MDWDLRGMEEQLGRARVHDYQRRATESWRTMQQKK